MRSGAGGWSTRADASRRWNDGPGRAGSPHQVVGHLELCIGVVGVAALVLGQVDDQAGVALADLLGDGGWGHANNS